MTSTAAPAMTLDWLPHSPTEVALGHDVDMLQLFWRIKQDHPIAYFFESVSHPRHQDRFHVIGFDPAMVLTARGDVLRAEGQADVVEACFGTKAGSIEIAGINPYAHLSDHLAMDKGARSHQGGLIGFFCHEAMNYFEPAIDLAEHDQFEPFKLGLFLDGLILDTETQTLSYYTFAEDRSDYVRGLLNAAPVDLSTLPPAKATFKGDSESKDSFMAKVASTQQKIFEGYSFQAEVGMKSFFEIEGDKFTIYCRLREVNPSPYMFYVQFGEQVLFGASPEILISSKSGRILTTPTAGTIRRGDTPEEDAALARQLLSDPKEIAEHNMLVDLHRNDVSMVSIPGTVVVDNLMYLIKFSHVQHIVSDVVGIQDKRSNSFDVLKCILPGGVVTGAPKIETVKIIDSNEALPRGPYGGAVGRFSLSGDCDFALPIRSLFCFGNDCFAQTSAGVVYDSVPDKEYAEVQKKLGAMKKTLSYFGAEE